MRCTRCDRVAVPQAVGLLPDGLVVFGWCLACLAESDCRLVEVPDARPSAARPPPTRGRTPAGIDPEWSRRRRLVISIAGTLVAWAAILIALGLARLTAPGARGPLGEGSAWMLLIGGVLMALTALAVWGTTLARGPGRGPCDPRRGRTVR